MAKIPIISGKQFGKILEKHGWIHKRTKGSHMVFVKEGVLHNCSVPNHKELAMGTLQSLLKKSNLTIEDITKKSKR